MICDFVGSSCSRRAQSFLIPIRRPFWLIVFLLAISSANSHAQSNAANISGSLQGHVTCDDGGFPARGAMVELTPLSWLLTENSNAQTPVPQSQQQLQSAAATTDFNGYYFIPSLQPGTYVINVRLPGYSLDFDYVQSVLNHFQADKQKEMLAEFPQLTVQGTSAVTQDLVIHRGAAITGHVRFDSGGALDRAKVTATMVSEIASGNGVSDAWTPSSPSAQETTDDRGAYRIAGLPHGKYRIEVHLRENGVDRGIEYFPIFAPGVLSREDSALVAVADGDELSGVDIEIPLRLFHSISGTVMRDGVPVAGASITIQRAGQSWSRTFASDSNGNYRIDMLPQGAYTLEGQYPPADEEKPGPFFRHKISVQLGDGDVPDANLNLLNRPPAQ